MDRGLDKKVVYLSGPMTGLPQFNFPAFNDAAAKLRADGYEVISPAENYGGRHDLPRKMYLRLDVEAVLEVDMIVLLDGWELSKGACLEVAIARELELPIVCYPDMTECVRKVFFVVEDE